VKLTHSSSKLPLTCSACRNRLIQPGVVGLLRVGYRNTALKKLMHRKVSNAEPRPPQSRRSSCSEHWRHGWGQQQKCEAQLHQALTLPSRLEALAGRRLLHAQYAHGHSHTHTHAHTHTHTHTQYQYHTHTHTQYITLDKHVCMHTHAHTFSTHYTPPLIPYTW
jgi:hypothetical protein